MSRPTRFQEAIRQQQPFRSPAHEGVIALLVVADRLQRHFGKVLCASGITPQQYNVLRILRGAGSEGTPTLDVADRMIEQTPGVTRLLDRLEAKGLVSRSRLPEDRRQVWCRITPAGLALVDRLDGVMDQADTDALGGLAEADQRRLVGLLERVLDELE